MSNNIEFAHLCPGCFAEKGSTNICPQCGYDESLKRGPLVLAHRTLLHNGQYLIGKVLGKPGGFGITYLALDTRLETRVAIKEYLPRDLAGRDAGQATINAHSLEDGEFFRYGLTQFLQEARTLARFDHANIVRVRNFFEENGTGYLVMDYYDGVTLADHLAQQPQGRLTEETAVGILMPILDGLREVHAKNILHRDIKPQNIYLTTGNRPILLDFGAARQAMSERSRSLSVVLSEGYAPYEQYHRRGEQGPWTDIYASAAVLYHAVAGERPPPATERVAEDELDIDALGVSAALTSALRAGLAVDPRNRPQTVAEFQGQLLGDGEPPVLTEVFEQRPEKANLPNESTRPAKPPASGFGFTWVALVVVIGVIWFVMGNRGTGSAQDEAPPVHVVAEAETTPADLAGALPTKGGSVTYRTEKYKTENGGEGHRLVVTLDGKRLEVSEHSHCIKIYAQKDFNGDGVMDALISPGCPGSSGMGSAEFVSIADGKVVTVYAPIDFDDKEGIGEDKIVKEGNRFLVKSESDDATEYWSFDGQKAIKVRSIPYSKKTVKTVVDCLRKEQKNCPGYHEIFRNDKKFGENLRRALNKSGNPIEDLTRGLASAELLIKNGDKTYLKLFYWDKYGSNISLVLFLEIDELASSEGRLIGVGESFLLNSPTQDERLFMSKEVCPKPTDGNQYEPHCKLLKK